MARMAELAAEVEDLYYEGYSPRSIAQIVEVPLWEVLGYLENISKNTQKVVDNQCEWL